MKRHNYSICGNSLLLQYIISTFIYIYKILSSSSSTTYYMYWTCAKVFFFLFLFIFYIELFYNKKKRIVFLNVFVYVQMCKYIRSFPLGLFTSLMQWIVCNVIRVHSFWNNNMHVVLVYVKCSERIKHIFLRKGVFRV